MMKERDPPLILDPLILDPDICSTLEKEYPLITAYPIVINAQCEPMTRREFIAKVYGTLWLQLIFTSLFIGLCNQNHQLQVFMISPVGIYLLYLSIISLLVMSCSLFCCYNSLRVFPYNYFYVIFFTLMMSYSIGIVGVMYNAQSLLLAGLSTTGIFSGLTIYAVQTKVDYTTYGNIAIILLFGLLLFGFITSFIHIAMLQTIYSVGGSVLFSFYIIYDTQLIIGGSGRKIEYTTDDFALASVNLYLDIVNLFLFMLEILNGR